MTKVAGEAKQVQERWTRSNVGTHAAHRLAHHALLVQILAITRSVLNTSTSNSSRRRHVDLFESRTFARAADREEEVERPVDERRDAEPGEERHLVDARRGERHAAAGGACESDDINEDAGDVGGVCAAEGADGIR